MNLVKAQELAKELSIADLQKYANGSNPELMPPYIALGALQAKEAMQKKMQAMQGAAQGEQPSVKEQVEQKAGLMALQGQQQQQAQQQMMQQAQSQPMPAPEGIPQPEAQPQAEPTMMAAGGITRLPVNFNFKDGGIIGYAGPEGSAVEDPRIAAANEASIRYTGFPLSEAQIAKLVEKFSSEKRQYAAGEAAARKGQMYPVATGFDEEPTPQAAPAKPEMSPEDKALRQAPASGLPAAIPKPAPVAAPVARPQMQAVSQAQQPPQVPQVSDQDKLIAEEAARRKAFGIDQEIGAGAESRMADQRKRFEESRPTGLQDLIRFLSESSRSKGFTGMGPAYLSGVDKKRAEEAAFESQMEQQQTGIEEKRRAERVARAGGIGEGLGKMREIQQREREAKERNLTSIEVANIQRLAQNDPKAEERLFNQYIELKKTNPDLAAEMIKFRGGAAATKGVMTRNEAIDNVKNLMSASASAPMEMKKEAAAALGKKDPTFSEVLEYFVQKNMGTLPSGGTSATAPTRIKFDAQGNPIK